MTSSPRFEHKIVLVRPGSHSLAWLEHVVRYVKGDDPLQPVTVVGWSPYLVTVMRQKLAERGCANVSFQVQLRPLAEHIARGRGSRAFDRPLTGPLEAAAIRVAIRESAETLLQPLAGNRALQESLGALFRDLRHLDDAEPALTAIAQGGSVGSAARRTYAAFRDLTLDFPDVPHQLRIAAGLMDESSQDAAWAGELGPVVLYLPVHLDAAELEFIVSLSHHVPLMIALPWLDDALADAPTREDADALSVELETPVTQAESPAAWPHINVLSAPDPEEEARTILRQLLADVEGGVPLWRMAVLYTSDEPYAPLIRETLDAARVSWHSALGRPASAGLAARSLLALLGLRERGFTREGVLDWLAARPRVPSENVDPLPDVPISAWDRLSRRAQVLQGAEQWVNRFERLITTLEAEERARRDWHRAVHTDEEEDETPRPGHDLEYARAIAAAIRRLDRDTRPPADNTTWDALVDWALGLRRAYVKDDPGWPAAELLAAQALDDALNSLREASALEPATTLAGFLEALASALEARRLNEGRAGVGVLVAPVGATSGATFERAYVLGLAEGLLPSRLSADPLAGSGTNKIDPLGRRERQRADERRAFVAALTSVNEEHSVVLSYSRTDGAARASFPSRWLLEQVARLEGVPAIYASDLGRLFGPGRPWLRRIASAYDGLLRTAAPISVADVRLGEVITAHAAGHDISEIALAARHELVLGRALSAARARQSREFTEFDGNLAPVVPGSARITSPLDGRFGGSSATALERWVGCPFRYFLSKVLAVEATERPEEEWTLNPLAKGTLVHAALEAFFRERLEQGRSRPDEPFTEADHVRLDEIATALLADLEAQGRTGHAVAWQNARAALLRDLHLELDREETWRIEEGLAPSLFERTFGDLGEADTWPAVEVPLADGSVVHFRGAIDRIDVGPSRALVIDYKSGGTWGYDGLEADPVLAGRHLQLALYARAARANISGADEIRAEFRFVSSKGKFERRQIVASGDADERLAEVVQRTADGIRAGVFLPRPGDYDRGTFKNCRFCDYDRICSTSRDLAWQRKSPGIPLLPPDPGA